MTKQIVIRTQKAMRHKIFVEGIPIGVDLENLENPEICDEFSMNWKIRQNLEDHLNLKIIISVA